MRASAVEVAARRTVRPHTASSFREASRNSSPLAAGAGIAGRTSSVMRRSSCASSSGTPLSKRSCTTCRGTDRAAEAVMGPIRPRAPPGAWAWRRGVAHLLGAPSRGGAGRRGARAGAPAASLQLAAARRPTGGPAAAGVSAQRGARSLGAGFGRRLWACGRGCRNACERVWGHEGGCAQMEEAPGGRARGWRRVRRRGRAGARSPAAGCAQTLTLASAARSVPRRLPAGPRPWLRGAARRGAAGCGAGRACISERSPSRGGTKVLTPRSPTSMRCPLAVSMLLAAAHGSTTSRR